MVDRTLAPVLERLAGWYPIVTVLGPRQSGKTTLCRSVFGDLAYHSFERADIQAFAREDPLAFIDDVRAGAVLDEIQHVPELLGYLQVEVDEDPTPGRFVLTGSQNLAVSQAVTQSLAGRTGVCTLLPLGLEELARFPDPPVELWDVVWTGGYPRIHDVGIPPTQWLGDYFFNYVQRDVRQVYRVGDLEAFTTFVRLAAGRTGQVINLSALGSDAGVSQPTARAWLSVLEAGYLVHRLPAWHRSVRKQMTRAAKLHFLDSGLVCFLLGIRSPEELRHHSQRGAIFESFVVSEVLKAHSHRGRLPRLFHYRDARRLEVDLVDESSSGLDLVEIKSGRTVAGDWSRSLMRLRGLLQRSGSASGARYRVVYGGRHPQRRSDVQVLPWRAVPRAFGADEGEE